MKSHRYIALLRGVNVGGTGIMKMTDLKNLFERAGFTQVETYIQSGNVLFNSKDADNNSEQIENRLAAVAKMNITAFIYTAAELKKAVKNNPLEPEKNEEERQSHLMFLSEKPSAENQKALMAMQGDEYIFSIVGKVLYYSYSKALAGKRRNINFEKVLGVTGTSRTWKVVDKLIELAK